IVKPHLRGFLTIIKYIFDIYVCEGDRLSFRTFLNRVKYNIGSIFKNNSNVSDEILLDSEHKIPYHIAIIPDGNRRWAQSRGLTTEEGHREGANNFKRIVIACSKLNVKYITFYAFSTENWSRDEKEVHGLMNLMLEFLKNADKELEGN